MIKKDRSSIVNQTYLIIIDVVSLNIPTDTLASLTEVADNKDMSVEALLKLYIGQGLRQDISKLFNER